MIDPSPGLLAPRGGVYFILAVLVAWVFITVL